MHLARKTILLYLGLVFTSGLAVGAFGFRLYNNVATVKANTVTRSPEEYRKQSMEILKQRLKLTDAQVDQWNKSLDDNQAEVRKVHDGTLPQLKSIHEEHVARVHSFLSKEQGDEYDKILAEREARGKQKRARKGS